MPDADGSPPRAWGILPLTGSEFRHTRFTPTCVGNTLDSQSAFGASPVHPHVRGEYSSTRSWQSATIGSPPRAWGIRQGYARRIQGHRFTPTCVGNTLCSRRANACAAVHPHVRGEYPLFRLAFRPHHGSPPRAWGIPHHPHRRAGSHRFTPTCVGNTLHRRPYSPTYAVHPHVRGEYATSARAAFDNPRFTPTCVGNTASPTASR